jgi:uncharacterized protein YdhG (YjbR/CyaY superfamily)
VENRSKKIVAGSCVATHRKVFDNIDEYIATFPKNVQSILEELRQAIRESAPEAQETISYQMPAFKLNGILLWFAAYKNHVGFYPKTSAIEAFKEELSGYEVSKGTIRFPIDKPVPFNLVKKIVRYRVKENLEKKE